MLAKAAYRAVFEDLGTFFAAASPWVFITAFAYTAFDETFASSDSFFRPYAGMVLELSCSVPFLVSWHRRVLTGEPLSPLKMLRFDSRDWRFFQVSLVVVATGFAPVVVLVPIGYLLIFTGWWPVAEVVFAWVPFIILISIIFSSIKFSLAFPLAALDRVRSAIREAIRLSRGQEWTLAIALLLSTGPLWIVRRGLAISMESLWSSPKTYPLSLALYLIGLLRGYLSLALAASTASFAYLAITRSTGDPSSSSD
jgi:ABC-type multidrug transport system fused ATPase/permease subunit